MRRVAHATPWPARRVVRSAVGYLPALDLRLRVTRAVGTAALRAREEYEIRSLASATHGLPEARVATIIPTYRRNRLLREAVDSALAQTEDDHLVVVVDDGGNECTLAPHTRLRTLRLSRNVGVPTIARNVAMRLTRSPFVAFLDDDNVWDPDHLAVSLAEHARGAEMTYTSLRRLREDGSVYDVIGEPFDRTRLRDASFVDTSAVVVRRGPGIHQSRVPRRGALPGEDWEYVWRLSRSRDVRHVDRITVTYRMHASSYFTRWPEWCLDASCAVPETPSA